MIYLDNAATTAIAPEVIDVVGKTMTEVYGNPSSIHQAGKKAKALVELSRKEIASCFNVASNEIVFTAGATEANNFILFNAVENLGVTHIITSKIEHHAVLNVVLYLSENKGVEVFYVDLDESGEVDLNHLSELLKGIKGKVLVSLMMVNNELGNLLPIKQVSELCVEFGALFHSDTVQAIGHYAIDLQKIPVDFITASAHKLHGPKGVGFAYVKKDHVLKSFVFGGGQERGLRSGTENVHAIVGMCKAMQLAYSKLQETDEYLQNLKKNFIAGIQKLNSDIVFNGLALNFEKSSNAIVNVRFPFTDKLLLLKLDIKGVCVSSGSACQSGTDKGSHVLAELLSENELSKTSLRFSFSRYTVLSELEEVIKIFKTFLS